MMGPSHALSGAAVWLAGSWALNQPLWPIPIRRRMWRMIGVPDAFAVRAGGKVELLSRGAFVVVCLLATTAMFAPSLFARFTPEL